MGEWDERIAAKTVAEAMRRRETCWRCLHARGNHFDGASISRPVGDMSCIECPCRGFREAPGDPLRQGP